MPWQMASDAEIRRLPVAEQLFAFARAYLTSAIALCERAVQRAGERDWPSGAVVLLTAAHSVELFLKAAILTRLPSSDVWSRGHSISTLAEDYVKFFPEPELAWYVPFKESAPGGMSEEEEKFFRSSSAPPSILFRYPVNKEGVPWVGLHAFEPHSFLRELKLLEADFERIHDAVA